MLHVFHILLELQISAQKKLGVAAEPGNHAVDKLLPWRALAFRVKLGNTISNMVTGL